MPRFPSPVAPPGTERLVRTLMVAYKGRDQCVPSCKVWLDGAGELSPSRSVESSSAQLSILAPQSFSDHQC